MSWSTGCRHHDSTGSSTRRRRLANLLENEAPPDLVVAESVGVILAPDQRPVPDVAIIRGFESIQQELSNFQADRVVLVAEVVSRSTRSRTGSASRGSTPSR